MTPAKGIDAVKMVVCVGHDRKWHSWPCDAFKFALLPLLSIRLPSIFTAYSDDRPLLILILDHRVCDPNFGRLRKSLLIFKTLCSASRGLTVGIARLAWCAPRPEYFVSQEIPMLGALVHDFAEVGGGGGFGAFSCAGFAIRPKLRTRRGDVLLAPDHRDRGTRRPISAQVAKSVSAGNVRPADS